MTAEPKVNVPSFDALMWPALKAMKALGGSAGHEELLEKLIDLETIPEVVQNVMHTERQTKLSYDLAWAKTYFEQGWRHGESIPRIVGD